ncbi:DVU_1556 family methyltransferase [Maridesulfovibrio frigidus]|uniref:DVU_1556 family methyltransferase n=1 Tax=Maridesulfovibrio frigidus TaxID=340956 RepID=UPI0004E1A41D|nr:class I SAM-dependent methyltransferase [Maridesulfovibrio frigidus]
MTQTGLSVPLWEKETLREAAGTTLRPGGLNLTDRALSLAAIPQHGRVLDVGCGLGTTVQHLNKVHLFETYGVDISMHQIKDAPLKLGLSQANATGLPFACKSFDALVCECVLSILPDISQALTEFKRVLTPSGTLIISDLFQRGLSNTTGISDSCASSPIDAKQLNYDLYNQGFRTTIQEDHSKVLTELAARLIFLGEKSIIPKQNCCDRPGYMLLIAKVNDF